MKNASVGIVRTSNFNSIRLFVSGLFIMLSSLFVVHAADCESGFYKNAKVLPEYTPVVVDAFLEQTEELFYFWLPGELSISSFDEGSFVFYRNYEFSCGSSFSNYSERLLEADLDLFSFALQVDREEKDFESDADSVLPAGFYSALDFEIIDPIENEPYRVVWRVETEDTNYVFTLHSRKKPELNAALKFLGEELLFVKEPVGFECIEVYEPGEERLSYHNSFGDIHIGSSKPDFQKYFEDDFVIERRGFGRYGSYREATKPLSSGGSLTVRIQRYDSFFWDPYQRRWPRSYRYYKYP